jgi:hypothetical protein
VALNDPTNPVAQTAQSFFQVVSKAAAGRVRRRSSSPEPRHHHHHHHNNKHHHHHHGDDDKVIVNGDHDHVHVHRRQSSVVIQGEDNDDEQTYIVHSERDVPDPEGSIQVVVSASLLQFVVFHSDSMSVHRHQIRRGWETFGTTTRRTLCLSPAPTTPCFSFIVRKTLCVNSSRSCMMKLLRRLWSGA